MINVTDLDRSSFQKTEKSSNLKEAFANFSSSRYDLSVQPPIGAKGYNGAIKSAVSSAYKLPDDASESDKNGPGFWGEHMPELLITKDIPSKLNLKEKTQVYGPDGEALSSEKADTFHIKRFKQIGSGA